MNLLSKKIVIIFLLVILLIPIMALAQAVEFVPLVPDLPGITPGDGIGPYIKGIFNLAIGIAIVLAVIMLVIGGVQYMLTDSVVAKGKSKETMLAAVGGLVLALVSVTLLLTINPDLISLDFANTVDELQQQSSGSGG